MPPAAQRDPGRALLEAARLFSEGAFHVPLGGTFPLARAAEAYTLCAGRHASGKLVISLD